MNSRNKLCSAIGIILAGATAFAANNVVAADKDLLDMLKSNGAITEAQYNELIKKGEKSTNMLKNMAWAERITIKGDLRVRQEFINIDANGQPGKDRQRYRARIGIEAKVAKNVDASVRLASGSSDGATSTNQNMGDTFNKDQVWIDLAYLDWHPLAGLNIFAGKMRQPWEKVGDVIWDNDVNPEGLAVKYSADLGGANLTASGGFLVLNNIDGLRFDEDASVVYGQLAGQFKLGSASTLLGATVYDYKNAGAASAAIVKDGNNTTKFGLYEVFGSLKLKTPLPAKIYGQYVKNSDANGVNDGEDTAWLIGFGTKYDKFKFDYNYRKTELNAVSGAFNDSDFAYGKTDSKGHKFKFGYGIDKNFGLGITYFMAETDSLASIKNSDINTLHIDLKAKF